MTKNNLVFIALLVVAIFSQSCKGEDIYYQQFQEIENNSWEAKGTKSFDFEIQDTTKLYTFYFNLRNTADYGYGNLYLFWKLNSPDGRTKTDTAQFILAKEDGKWLGKSVSGTLIENSMFFFRTKLPVRGLYSFDFTQGMREESLAEIQNVGLKIIKSDE